MEVSRSCCAGSAASEAAGSRHCLTSLASLNRKPGEADGIGMMKHEKDNHKKRKARKRKRIQDWTSVATDMQRPLAQR
jgi:hypothetical protein